MYTRLRHQCSSLGADLSRANITDDLRCPCGCPSEDVIHYLLECPLYTNARECKNGIIYEYYTVYCYRYVNWKLIIWFW